MISPFATQVIPPRLAEVIRIEKEIGTQLRRVASCPTGDPEVDGLLADLADGSKQRTIKLEARWAALSPDTAVPEPLDPGATSPGSPVESLRLAFELLSRGMIAYAALAPSANRVRDSTITEHDGMTGHAARDGVQECLMGMGAVTGMIPAVVLRELDREGVECQCTCPACGLGLCVCGNGMKAAISEAWLAARPTLELSEAQIPKPRATSAAAAAGFLEGDRILSVADATLASYPQLQTTIKSYEMGESIAFEVERDGAVMSMSTIRAADVGDSDLPIDCEVPSGEAFYLDRARDLQQRLRRRPRDEREDGIEALSVRELQVMRLLVDGATNPMIASKMRIKRPTVARHVQNILTKLNVTNRAEAAGMGARHGLSMDG